MPDDQIKYARTFLPIARDFCAEARFGACHRILEAFLFMLNSEEEIKSVGGRGVDASTFTSELGHLREALHEEIKKHRYVHVASDRIDYLLKKDLFGPEVYRAFPSARYDIAEAGNSLAVELNTATVFHLMRAAEYGLRALAYDRRVKVPRGPLDLATWEDILKELDKAENAIQGYPKTHAREAQYEFYHGAMMELRAFKNVWRNRFLHTRADFRKDKDRDKAKSVMTDVGDFMKILASKIAEGKRTPRIWKKV